MPNLPPSNYDVTMYPDALLASEHDNALAQYAVFKKAGDEITAGSWYNYLYTIDQEQAKRASSPGWFGSVAAVSTPQAIAANVTQEVASVAQAAGSVIGTAVTGVTKGLMSSPVVLLLGLGVILWVMKGKRRGD